MGIALIIVLGVLAILAFVAVMLVVVPRIAFSMMEKPLRARIGTRYAPSAIVLSDLRANSFGVESKGRGQVRGNGALVVTAAELCFFQLVPRSELVIPLGSITAISTVKSHLGKTIFRPLLKVSFTNPAGEPDSVAFALPDVERWTRTLSSSPPTA